MELIEITKDPKIGETYLVRSVTIKKEVKSELGDVYIPVFSESHSDGKYGRGNEHFHVDWRFASEWLIEKKRKDFETVFHSDVINREYFTPIDKEWVLEDIYTEMKYLRDFPEFPKASFRLLEDKMKDAIMKYMICPHHGTNLISCRPIDGVVTCPQHGLKWNINTGKLVI